MSTRFIIKIKKGMKVLLASFGKRTLVGDCNYIVPGFILNRLLLTGYHEPWLDFAYEIALKIKPGIFVDVGANVGQTLLKVLSLDRNITYIGFEPQVSCCFFISEFLTKNKFAKCKIFPIGLSNKTGLLTLFKRANDTDVTASVVEGFRPKEFYAGTESVFVTTGDEVVSKLGFSDIGIVKIDVEGGELEVLEGLTRSLSTYTPLVFFEVLNHFIIATNQNIDAATIKFREDRVGKVEFLLRSLGYFIFNILPNNKLTEVTRITPTISKDLNITNYVAVHATCKEAFLHAFRRPTE